MYQVTVHFAACVMITETPNVFLSYLFRKKQKKQQKKTHRDPEDPWDWYIYLLIYMP